MEQIDTRKLCLMALDANETDEHIREMCERFGQLQSFNRPSNKKELAFALYNNESVAKAAKDSLSAIGIKVGYARARKAEHSYGNGNANGFENGVAIERTTINKRLDSFKVPSPPEPSISTKISMAMRDPLMSPKSDLKTSSSMSALSKYGVCKFCGNDASMTCNRCGDFYCSEECQKEDWLDHKQVCFPMPKLVPPKLCHCSNRHNLLRMKTASVENIHINKRNNSVTAIDAPDGMSEAAKELFVKEVIDKLAQPKMSVDTIAEEKFEPRAKTPSVVSVIERPQRAQQIETAPEPEPEPKPTETQKPPSHVSDDFPKSPSKLKINLQTNFNQHERCPIENGDIAEITFVPNHFSIFIRPINPKYEADFAQMVVEGNILAKDAPHLQIVPERNDLVLAPFEGAYYRGMVLNADSEIVEVAFVDFGNTAKVPFSEVKQAPFEVLKYPRYATKCFLKNVEREITESESQAIYSYLKQLEYLKFKVKCDDSPIEAKSMVELIDINDDKIINDEIAKMVKKRIYEAQIPRKTVKSTDEMMVLMECRDFPDKCIVTGVLKSDLEKFGTHHDQLQKYGESVKNAPAYKPKHLEMCLALVMDAGEAVWYRAQFQQSLADGRAQFGIIDYGVTLTGNESDIRELSKDLVFESVALQCRVKRALNLTKAEAVKLLQPFKKFRIIDIAPIESSHLHNVEFDFTDVNK